VNLRRRRDAVTRAERELNHARAALTQSLGRLQKDGSDALTPMRIVGAGFALGAIGGLLRPWATASSTLALLNQSLRGARSLTELLKTVADVTAYPRTDGAADGSEETTP
jgi:hypothetical protein